MVRYEKVEHRQKLVQFRVWLSLSIKSDVRPIRRLLRQRTSRRTGLTSLEILIDAFCIGRRSLSFLASMY